MDRQDIQIEGLRIAVLVELNAKDETEPLADFPWISFGYVLLDGSYSFDEPVRWKNPHRAMQMIWQTALSMLPEGTSSAVVSALDGKRLDQYEQLARFAGYKTTRHWDDQTDDYVLEIHL